MGEEHGMARIAATASSAGTTLAAWAALALLHLAFAGRLGWEDLVVAMLSAGAAVLLLRWVDHASGRRFRHHPERLLLAGRIARHIARDCIVVGRTLFSSLRRRHSIDGVFREFPWTPPDDPREAASLRALIAIGISTAPNSYVVDVAHGPKGQVIMHHLVPPSGAEEQDQIWLP